MSTRYIRRCFLLIRFVADTAIKPFIGLCNLVAHPSLYHSTSAFPDAHSVQNIVSSVFELGGDSSLAPHSSSILSNRNSDVDLVDITWDFRYLIGPLEIEAFAIAKRLLKSVSGSGIGIPRMVCDGDEIIIDIEPEVQDYLFFSTGGPKAWSWPGFRLDEESWGELVRGVETESD